MERFKAVRRRLLTVSTVLLLLSLAGVFTTRALPNEIEQEVSLLDYEHQGEFDYLVTLKPSYLFGPEPQEPPPPLPEPPPLSSLKYPVEFIDRFNFTFAYQFVTEKPVMKVSEEVKATAIIPKGAGEKPEEITLVPVTLKTGNFTIDFSLVMSENISSGDITINIYVYPTIQTEKGPIFGSFTQSWVLQSEAPLIEIAPTLESSRIDHTGELIYEQRGVLDYQVLLKPGSPFGATTLVPPKVVPPAQPTLPPSPPPKTIGSGEVIFPKLVDKIDATFHYEFKSDKRISGLSEEVGITAVLENPKVWSKSFVLVPLTKQQGDFTVSFPIDINEFARLLEAIRTETGAAAESYTLTIRADVHAVAQTDFGPINETFNQTLSTTLGEGTLKWNEELKNTQPGSIKETGLIPNPNKYLGLSLSGVRSLSAAAAGVFFLFFLFSLVVFVRFKPLELFPLEKEALLARKKHGDVLIDVEELPEAKDREVVIVLDSLDELVKAADALMKPVLHKVEPEKHIYCVIDGATRYQYVSWAKPQVSQQPKPPLADET